MGDLPTGRAETETPPPRIEPGSIVWITDVGGKEHPARATTPITRGRDFLVVWVIHRGPDGSGPEREPIPWPADAVRLATP